MGLLRIGRFSLILLGATCLGAEPEPFRAQAPAPLPAIGGEDALGDQPPSKAPDTSGAELAVPPLTEQPAAPDAKSSDPVPAPTPAEGADAARSGGGPSAVPAKSAKSIAPVSPPGAPAAAPSVPAPSPLKPEAASFNGVTPGESRVADVEKAWGKPKSVQTPGAARAPGGPPAPETLVHLYKVDPFDRVEVSFLEGRAASIVIRLDKPFPANAVAQQLDLGMIRPVLVSNELGEILGQAFPERGVLFSFTPADKPGQATMKVSEIVLEPITADAFLLRAETNLDSFRQESLRDLEHALKLTPGNARAHWLRARLLSAAGQSAAALAAVEEALRRDPAEAQYQITRAELLGKVGRSKEAVAQAEKAIEAAGKRLHVKARAHCVLGDVLGGGDRPDLKRAMEQHIAAIKTAQPLSSSPHQAVRQGAKQAMLDAHLGMAHDIAWGAWKQKESPVTTWLKRAGELLDDVVQNEGGTVEDRFRVAARALAACVGAQGQVDPTPWAEAALKLGRQRIDAAAEADRPPLEWELGAALYDAVQGFQMRNQGEAAARFGQQAAAHMERSRRDKNPAEAYLLGRLYFRLGSLRAIGADDHRGAVEWFDKALPILRASIVRSRGGESGRLGESLVSMAISYWETGQRPLGVELTEQGIALIRRAIGEGALPASALEVPQGNLATMRGQLTGSDAPAEPRSARGKADSTPR